MVEKDSAYLELSKRAARPDSSAVQAPEVVTRIPNIDHRYGDGRAEVLGIAVLDQYGQGLHLIEPDTRIIVRISVRAHEELEYPNVGFMLRNHLGVDFSGTNTTLEGCQLPPMIPGDVYTIDFHVDMPRLYASSFSFTPAIADGSLESYRMCDWIDNAITLQMGHGDGPIYGYMRLPCRVEVNSRIASGGVQARA
jgi:hypothetical protein